RCLFQFRFGIDAVLVRNGVDERLHCFVGGFGILAIGDAVDQALDHGIGPDQFLGEVAHHVGRVAGLLALAFLPQPGHAFRNVLPARGGRARRIGGNEVLRRWRFLFVVVRGILRALGFLVGFLGLLLFDFLGVLRRVKEFRHSVVNVFE